MRTIIASRYLIGLIALAAVSAACSSDEGGSGSDVPSYVGPLTPVPGAPAAPGAPPAAPGDPLAPGGVATPGTEGQPGAAAPLDPAAPAPDGSGAPAPAAPTDGTPPPAAPPGTPPAAASFFTSGAWSGPVVPEAVLDATTLTPESYDDRAPDAPFCASGSVAPDADFRGVARIKFTLSQPDGSGPQAVVPQANGLAFTFTRTTGSLIRVLLQPPAAADGTVPEGWCYAIPEVEGQAFAPYSEFSTRCFDRVDRGAIYANEPIEAISFNAPGGNEQPTDYDFCVAGIADGNDETAAPAVPAGFLDGDITGILRSNFERAVVTDAQGRKLVVQNNGWGTSLVANSQQLSYTNNSFTVMSPPAGGVTNEPLSFPSIYIGESGFIDGAQAISTRRFDNLPIRIADITAIPTRFAHTASGNVDANATYDVWFAPNAPTAEYGTATGAFLMVWTHKPGRNAIGNMTRTSSLGGENWQVFVGLRGSGSGATGADANVPVISYISTRTIPDYSFDLKDFIDEAVAAGEMNGNQVLTDVFAGFEIWSGGQGLSVTNFEVEVQGNGG